MIQRVQTIYLFLAAVLSVLLFFMPLASVDIPVSPSEGIQSRPGLEHEMNIVYEMDVFSITQSAGFMVTKVQDTYWLAGLNAIILIMTLVIIFLFRNRPLQSNMIRFCFLLVLIFIVLAFYYTQMMQDLTAHATINYKVADLFPLLQLLFLYLANRGVTKDETLVRSADRIR